VEVGFRIDFEGRTECEPSVAKKAKVEGITKIRACVKQ